MGIENSGTNSLYWSGNSGAYGVFNLGVRIEQSVVVENRDHMFHSNNISSTYLELTLSQTVDMNDIVEVVVFNRMSKRFWINMMRVATRQTTTDYVKANSLAMVGKPMVLI